MIPIVLFYHQVLRRPRPEHYWLRSQLTVDQFKSSMIEIKERWHPLTVDEFTSIGQKGGRWPKRSVLITFDDGFKNNLWAAEILAELEMNALFFVIRGVVGSRFEPWYVRFAEAMSNRQRDAWQCSWGAVDYNNEVSRRRWLKLTKEHLLSLAPEQRDAALSELAEAIGAKPKDQPDPDLEFFTAADVHKLASLGMTVGGHSRTHDNLTRCNPQQQRDEMIDATDELSQQTSVPIRHFSYPDGRFDDATVRLARERFDAAFTTETRYTAPDMWRFPRRAADGVTDVGRVLNPLFPAKRAAIDTVKRLMRF